jgi:antitoxin MazE
MRVSKWGNSLAIRIPSAVVEALKLREGTEVVVRVASSRELEIGVDRSREQAIQRLRKFRGQLPAGFIFDREEANAR